MSVQGGQGRDWPVGFVFFASIMMLLVGVFHGVTGIAGVVEEGSYAAPPGYVLEMSVTAWGWIHLVVGVLVAFAGLALMTDAMWARVVAIIVAMVSALASFAFIPVYAPWSFALLALDVAVIWALGAHGESPA